MPRARVDTSGLPVAGLRQLVSDLYDQLDKLEEVQPDKSKEQQIYETLLGKLSGLITYPQPVDLTTAETIKRLVATISEIKTSW